MVFAGVYRYRVDKENSRIGDFYVFDCGKVAVITHDGEVKSHHIAEFNKNVLDGVSLCFNAKRVGLSGCEDGVVCLVGEDAQLELPTSEYHMTMSGYYTFTAIVVPSSFVRYEVLEPLDIRTYAKLLRNELFKEVVQDAVIALKRYIIKTLDASGIMPVITHEGIFDPEEYERWLTSNWTLRVGHVNLVAEYGRNYSTLEVGHYKLFKLPKKRPTIEGEPELRVLKFNDDLIVYVGEAFGRVIVYKWMPELPIEGYEYYNGHLHPRCLLDIRSTLEPTMFINVIRILVNKRLGDIMILNDIEADVLSMMTANRMLNRASKEHFKKITVLRGSINMTDMEVISNELTIYHPEHGVLEVKNAEGAKIYEVPYLRRGHGE